MTRKNKSDLRARRRGFGAGKSFHRHYEEAEQRRLEILARLQSLNDKARAHPAYKRALTLLNPTFRKATLAQRMAVLSAADWLVDLIETLSIMV